MAITPATPATSASTLVLPPYPMLARTGKLSDLTNFTERGYICEQKLDGVRCLAVVGGMGSVQLYTRQLRNITAAFPDVAESLNNRVGRNPHGPTVLDGEIVAWGSKDYLPNFQAVQFRIGRINDVETARALYRAEYCAFDVLSLGRTRLMDLPLESRLKALSHLCGEPRLVPWTESEAAQTATQKLGEGVMLKRLDSKYEPGVRSSAWLKIKWLQEVECYVGGVTYGMGKRAPYFGGLLCGVPVPGNADRLKYIGTVGTGFDDKTMAFLTKILPSLAVEASPFVDKTAGWDVKYFTYPGYKIKVQFQNYTRDGIMRFPRYVNDVYGWDVTYAMKAITLST